MSSWLSSISSAVINASASALSGSSSIPGVQGYNLGDRVLNFEGKTIWSLYDGTRKVRLSVSQQRVCWQLLASVTLTTLALLHRRTRRACRCLLSISTRLLVTSQRVIVVHCWHSHVTPFESSGHSDIPTCSNFSTARNQTRQSGSSQNRYDHWQQPLKVLDSRKRAKSLACYTSLRHCRSSTKTASVYMAISEPIQSG